MQERTHSFGYWLRRRRKALDLTQEALAQRVSCSTFSIRKIEADERRPSRRLAERLALALAIPEAQRREFLDAARAVRAATRLVVDGAPHGAPAFAASVAPATPDPAAPAGPFVGRRREFDLLTELVAQLGAGAGHTVLVEGEPGIGKSRLLREIARHAHGRGLPVLATNCYEIGAATAYQPVVDLVTRALDRASAPALHDLAPVSLAELAALVPEIGERFTGLPQLSNDFPQARQARLCRAVAQFLEAAGGAGASLLVVDDIQWADDASAQVFHYLARQAARRPMLAIYAYRDEAIDNDERFGGWMESLRRETHVRRLPLARLDRTATEHLVAALAPASGSPPDLAARLHRETEGNPFFLTSILQSLNEGETRLEGRADEGQALLPDALRAAVRARIARVPGEIRPVLETAAVLGRRFDFDTLLEATRLPEARLLDAVEALVRRRVLREEPEGGIYDFSHDKVREVVYRDTGGARRKLLHQAVADALESRAEPATHERDTQLAEHYERAHVWTKALRYLVLAGERSLALFAMRDALHWLDRAVALCASHPQAFDEAERLAIFERRGAARAQAGLTQGAVADMRRVLEAARSAGSADRTRDALVRLGMAYRRADAYADATACLDEALKQCRLLRDEYHAADTLYHLGTVAWSTGLNDRAIGFHQQAVEICERAGFADLVAVQAYHGRGEAHFANAEPAAAIACYARSLELARHIGDRSYESENLMMIGHACLGSKGLGDYPRATEHFEAALAIARAADLQWHMGPTLLGLAHAQASIGHYGEAWRALQETLRSLEDLEQVRYQLIAIDFIGSLLLDLGLNELAAERLERGLALGRDTGIMFWRATIAAHRAVARVRSGLDPDVAELRTILEHTRSNSERYLMVRCLDALAEIAASAGDAARCRAYADELLAIAALNGLRELEASARRWRGAAWSMQGAHAQARTELSHAAALAERIGRPRLALDAEGALAHLHAAQGKRHAAQHHGAKARALADTITQSLGSCGLQAQLRLPEAP